MMAQKQTASELGVESPVSGNATPGASAALRSRIMRSVPRERTTPEEAVAGALRLLGVRFRRNVRSLPGSPDLANKTRRFAIYVHGCFWHRHTGCARATTPKANALFWVTKFAANVARDARKERALRTLGYDVDIIWECQTKDPEELARIVSRIFPSNR